MIKGTLSKFMEFEQKYCLDRNNILKAAVHSTTRGHMFCDKTLARKGPERNTVVCHLHLQTSKSFESSLTELNNKESILYLF